MKFSQIKAVKDFCLSLMSEPNWREVLQEVLANESDFEVDNVRFIKSDDIDSILASELSNDHYILGCFNAGFLAGVTGWPIVLIEAAQKGEAFEALGKAIDDEGYCDELSKAYASADGYGHHFNHYDGNEEEVTINGVNYYVFDNR